MITQELYWMRRPEYPRKKIEIEIVMQEDKLVLECAAKEYLRRTSVFWTSHLVDHNRVTMSNQFALPVLGYLMWTQ